MDLTMRFAIISDVHANVHALQAVLDDLVARGFGERIYHLGDLVGYAAFPNETVDLIRSFRIQGVAGNYDSTVATSYEHCGCTYEDEAQQALSHRSFAWTLRHTRSSTKDALRRLPFRMDLRPGGGHRPGAKVVLVHGTPTLNTLYWHADRPDDFCRKMASTAGARPGDLIAFGHTHIPWVREVDGVWYLNTGSVGRPKDGDWRAGYAIVDMSGAHPDVEFVRVRYDVEAACDAIRQSELPDFFAEYLATGGTARPTAADLRD
jgi:predicted phosphodiesterase